MSLAQTGLVVPRRVSAYAIRPRAAIGPGVRSPPRRLRQARRHKSDTSSTSDCVDRKVAGESAPTSKQNPNSDPSAKTQSTTSPSSSPPPPAASSSSASSSTKTPANTLAAAATAPPAASAVSRSPGLREIIKASSVGRLGRWYTRVQDKRPYATQVCSSIIIYLFGDLSAQLLFPSEGAAPAKTQLEDTKTPAQSTKHDDGDEAGRAAGYDPWRTVRHLIVGTGSSIPSYNWFMFLHNHFNYPSKFLSILTKVVVQQMCFTPVFNTYFFGLHSLLAGATLEETWERLKKALPVSVTNSVKLWPAVTAFSFMYVPPQFRNVFSGCIAVGWQTYLSWLNQKAAREVEAAELAAAAGESAGASSPTHALSGGKMMAAAGSA